MWRREIEEGGLIPKGYGVAWRVNYGMKVICYPIPINLLIRLGLDIYYTLMHGLWRSRWEGEIIKFKTQAYHEFKENYQERLLYLKALMIVMDNHRKIKGE